MCSKTQQCLIVKLCRGSGPTAVNLREIMKINTHHPCILEVVQQSIWLVFAVRVTFNNHNLGHLLSIIERVFGQCSIAF